MEIQSVTIMMQDRNYNYDAVVKELRELKQRAEAQEREQEQKILEVIQSCTDLFDFDYVKRELIKNNWNAQAVINQEQAKNVFEICLVNANNTSESFPVSF